MEINSFMSANLASLQQTLQLSIINMEKNMTTSMATEQIKAMEQAQVSVAPKSEHILDIYV